MPKNTNKTKKKPGQILIQQQIMTLISQLIAKILTQQRSLNQIRHCLTGHKQI